MPCLGRDTFAIPKEEDPPKRLGNLTVHEGSTFGPEADLAHLSWYTGGSGYRTSLKGAPVGWSPHRRGRQ